jgi:putative ABC transport system permease protein
MTLKEIACRNLLRRKAKAGFVLSGLVVGVSTVVAILGFGRAMTHDINAKLERYGANILVVPHSESLNLSYGGISLGGFSFETTPIREAELKRLETIKNAQNIAALGPVVLGVVEAAGRQTLLAGMDMGRAGILKPWWQMDGRLPVEDGVLLGADAARLLNRSAGDRLELKGRSLRVDGVLRPTGSQDDQLIFSRIDTAQDLLGKRGEISMVEVAALCHDCPVEDMVGQISEALPGTRVMAIQQVVKGRMETLAQLHKFAYGISAVVLLVGSLVVLVTMMGSVRERTEEIGIFRAVGFRRRHVMGIVFMEAGIVSAIAGILGYLLGTGAAAAALQIFSPGRPLTIPFEPGLAAGAVLTAVFVGLAASAYPALFASRLDPNEALRRL